MQASNGARTEPAGHSILKYDQVAAASPNGAVANNISYPSPEDAHRGGPSPTEVAHQALPHVYGDDAHTQARARPSVSDPESQIHPQLRSFHDNNPPYAPTPNMMPSAIPQQPDQPGQPGPSASMMGASALEAMDLAADDATGNSADGKKKRELSTSKRAAQNRAAQRAFRQRKEGYIKQLESKVREFTDIEGQYKTLQSENNYLREYVLQLQSRIIDLKGDIPAPPPGLHVAHPRHTNALPQMASMQPGQAPQQQAREVPGAEAAIPQHPLAQVAQAVGGHLGQNMEALKYEPPARGSGHEEAMAAAEVARQLADGQPAGAE